MAVFPAVFVSHGSPDLLLHPSPAREFMQQLGVQLGKPKAILAISAHWLTAVPTLSTAAQPETLHDFRGFPAELYQLRYPAPGAADLAETVAQQLTRAGLEPKLNPDRGLDHGAWEPLMLMYPEANIPVTQLSLQPSLGPAYHVQLGRTLAELRQAGVLILASGAITHNLRAFGAHTFDADPVDWAKQFDDWLAAAILNRQFEDLVNYRQQAPYAVQNHPSEEHLLPLFVALGAGGVDAPAIQLHASFTYGVLSMAAYAFGAETLTSIKH